MQLTSMSSNSMCDNEECVCYSMTKYVDGSELRGYKEFDTFATVRQKERILKWHFPSKRGRLVVRAD